MFRVKALMLAAIIIAIAVLSGCESRGRPDYDISFRAKALYWGHNDNVVWFSNGAKYKIIDGGEKIIFGVNGTYYLYSAGIGYDAWGVERVDYRGDE